MTGIILRGLPVLAVAAWIALHPASAHAQAFNPAPSQTFAIDLDTKDGAFSQWRHLALGSASGFRATVEVNRLGRHERWLPYFRLCAETKEGCFGVVLSADQWKPPLRIYVADKRSKGDPTGQTIGVKEKVTIDLDWGVPGKVRFRVGSGRSQELSIAGPVTGIWISGSTGELTIHSLTLGKFTH